MSQHELGQLGVVAGRRYMPELDAVRGVAVLLVIFHHYVWCDELWVGTVVRSAARYGWIGVNIFFILSGFLITGLIIDGSERPRWRLRFYVSRLLRIVPAYYLAIAAATCWGIWSQSEVPTGSAIAFALAFVANFAAAAGVVLPEPMGVYWSLAVEEHFYLVWPWLVGQRAKRVRWVFALTAIVVPALLRGAAVRFGTGGVWYSTTPLQLDGIAWGALVAMAAREPALTVHVAKRVAWAGGAAGLGALIVLTRLHLSGLDNIIGAACVLTLLHLTLASMFLGLITYRRKVTERTGAWAILGFWGDISYFAYLNHQLIRDVLARLFGFHVGATGAVAVMQVVTSVGVVAILGIVSRRCFEQPILRLRDRFDARVVFAKAALSPPYVQ